MLTKLKQILVFDPDYPRPSMEVGETILREGTGASIRGYGGARKGALILTNRRLIWFETTKHPWPLKKIAGELALSDITTVDKGNLLNFLFGGMCIRLRLKTGNVEKLYECDGKLDEWITAVRTALAEPHHDSPTV